MTDYTHALMTSIGLSLFGVVAVYYIDKYDKIKRDRNYYIKLFIVLIVLCALSIYLHTNKHLGLKTKQFGGTGLMAPSRPEILSGDPQF